MGSEELAPRTFLRMGLSLGLERGSLFEPVCEGVWVCSLGCTTGP